MDNTAEKDCTALGGLFQAIVTDLKAGAPIWEDFLVRTAKLHSQLRCTVSATSSFLEALQRVADMATQSHGATRDVGKALTRLCMRHRSVEARLKRFTASLVDSLVIPLQDKLEDWKKVTVQIDRDHTKEFKRARAEIKKKSTDTLRLKKKVRKAASGSTTGPMQRSLDSALQDVSDQFILLEEAEKQAVRRALIEQRRRYCAFVACVKPVVEHELCLFEEMSHLEEAIESLCRLTAHPERLPSASEQVITDICSSDSGNNGGGHYALHSPPSSPSSLGSRKSSMCSISSCSMSSGSSNQVQNPNGFNTGSLHHHHNRNNHQHRIHHHQQHLQAHGPGAHAQVLVRHRSFSQPAPAQVNRLCSVSSQDSGFTSQDPIYASRLQRQGSTSSQPEPAMMIHLKSAAHNPDSPDEAECPYGFTPHTMSSTSVPIWTSGDDLYGTLSRPPSTRKKSASVSDDPSSEQRRQEGLYVTRNELQMETLYGTTGRGQQNPNLRMMMMQNDNSDLYGRTAVTANQQEPLYVSRSNGNDQVPSVGFQEQSMLQEGLYGRTGSRNQDDLYGTRRAAELMQRQQDFERAASATNISSTRPALTDDTFKPPNERVVVDATQKNDSSQNGTVVAYIGHQQTNNRGPPALPKRNSFSAANDVSPQEQPLNAEKEQQLLRQPIYANSAEDEEAMANSVDSVQANRLFHPELSGSLTLQRYQTYAGPGSRASIAGGASTLPPRRKPPPPPVRRTPPSSTLSLGIQQHKMREQQKQLLQELQQQKLGGDSTLAGSGNQIKPRLPPSSLALASTTNSATSTGATNTGLPAPPAELLSPSQQKPSSICTSQQNQDPNLSRNSCNTSEATAETTTKSPNTDSLPSEGRVQALQSIYETRAQLQQARDAFYKSNPAAAAQQQQQSGSYQSVYQSRKEALYNTTPRINSESNITADADSRLSRDNLYDSRFSRENPYEIRQATQRSIENIYDRQSQQQQSSITVMSSSFHGRSKSGENLDLSRENLYSSQSCSRDASRENLYEALPADKNRTSPPSGSNKPPTPPRKPTLQRAHTFGEHDSALMQSLSNMFNNAQLQRKQSLYEERRASLYSPPEGQPIGGGKFGRAQLPQHSGVTAVKAAFEPQQGTAPSSVGNNGTNNNSSQLTRTSSGHNVQALAASQSPPLSAQGQQPSSPLTPPAVSFYGVPLSAKLARSSSSVSARNSSPSPRSSVSSSAAVTSSSEDLTKRRFLQQLNAKLAESTQPATSNNGLSSASPQSASSQSTSFFSRSSNPNRRSVSETRGSSSSSSASKNHSSGVTDAAQRVHAWLSTRSSGIDIQKCRESLLEQIRGGSRSLKRQGRDRDGSSTHHSRERNNHQAYLGNLNSREIQHPHSNYSGATTIEQAVGGATNSNIHNNHHYH